MSGGQDPLAYGRYNDGRDDETDGQRGGGDRGLSDTARGFLSDGLKKLKDQYGTSPGQAQGQGQSYYSGSATAPPQPYQSGSYSQQPPPSNRPPKQDKLSSFLNKFEETVSGVGSQLAQKIGTTIDADAYAGYGSSSTGNANSRNRFGSFAPTREANDVKWHVDGFTYFWAVSRALESARESIWILDWWLSPELYLRRPPAKNEQYRLDRMLQAAAQRGVRVNIIVYKEVEAALTLSSAHTKHTLEALHPNIAVFRHPDHIPDVADIKNSLTTSFQNLSLDAAVINKLPGESLKALYGSVGDTVLYWAHHEKLCLIDGRIAFMGGLDLCFGRWDTNQHSIADVHPSDLSQIVFPGQDYNNARVLDFQKVSNWQENQLDRKQTGRMGWSDISISLRGPVVEDLKRHFVERWNYIYTSKYRDRNQQKYQRLDLYRRPGGSQLQGNSIPASQTPQPSQHGVSQPVPPNQGQLNSEPHWQQTHTQPPAQQPGQSYYPPTSAQQYFPPTSPNQGQQLPPPPPPPSTQQQQPQWQGQSQTGSQSYYPPPPPSQEHQQQSPYTGHSSTGNTLSPGQYYPPPPPGPAPSQSGNTIPGQYQNPPYASSPSGYDSAQYSSHSSTPAQAPYFPPPPGQESQQSQTQTRDLYEDGTRGIDGGQPGYSGSGRSTTENVLSDVRGFGHSLRGQLAGQVHQYQDRYITNFGRTYGNQSCQVVRSVSQWSGGIPTEHSVQDAYIGAIRNSRHFVYIENQFFITATGDRQKPVQNKIGAALVERILRAARAGEKYKVIVVMPSVPAFAGDLRDDSSLGTRAIMEFQYNSINRGGNSIMELIAKEGFNPVEYIRFYNLRNYDRINTNSTMLQAEKASGVNYEDARKYHDAAEVGYSSYGSGAPAKGYDTTQSYDRYQQAAKTYPSATSGRWDSVSECYMLGGQDIRTVPWDSDLPEIDAFITEELYIHSKVLIADDRIVICGSANLNDRSQLGTHDSEIALVIEDPTPLESSMDGQPFQASRFAASLRRELFRKHLGLLKSQDYSQPNANCEPVGVPNELDLSIPESQVVADPLSDTFQSLWNSRARTNTEVFRKVFNIVPDDYVRNWDAYKEFFEYNFRKADIQAEGKRITRPSKYEWGHVVRDNFAPGPEGAQQVKEQLSQVKGTLVEMPLMFLIEEDIAKEGLTLNALTEEVYT
ncbi:hypothetical protein TMatcc_002564 [Talaromyces marneffei ATCC 18224]|uniref:phospholipase D n=1 Tax=Talaromyces marneffei (strain ATCC 18224 / CBS 334.59 / QM 7333) TaxID=441960 RepID=B6Q2X0_TALMQ|nr:uncharacterized protein EYB26_002324 [Talaromyces marneffei]EEA29068.1 phospholipase D (PLD), putative [Talaromyces marneffei ATCC 18224]KAE8555335.1 hypothetical protein EYB25_000030 [Talaromyces marneffei]QGA14668.1 hypothetical protein EYB26_002324 [Talaromyces marneffei]